MRLVNRSIAWPYAVLCMSVLSQPCSQVPRPASHRWKVRLVHCSGGTSLSWQGTFGPRTTRPGGQLVLGPHVQGDSWSGGHVVLLQRTWANSFWAHFYGAWLVTKKGMHTRDQLLRDQLPRDQLLQYQLLMKSNTYCKINFHEINSYKINSTPVNECNQLRAMYMVMHDFIELHRY